MAEGGDAEWELCKENIRPLRQGRRITALQEALSQQQEGDNSAINQQRQAFESELRMYDGDDPLDIWDRYIKWTEQMFPQGGKESNLSTVLERAVTRFTEEKKYHNDPRYVEHWIKFAMICSEPLEIYRYMQAQGIGETQASFYIAWSEVYENQGNSRKADLIYQEGLKKHAEPQEKLQRFHKAMQARVFRQTLMKMDQGDTDDDDEPKEPERVSLADLKHRGKKKTIVPTKRTGVAVIGNLGGLRSQGATVSNRPLVIFDENKLECAGPSEPKLEPWGAPPPAKAKENEHRPEKWSGVKMRQKNKYGETIMALPPSTPTFQPFVEESDQPPTMTPCKINTTLGAALSTRKPRREETPLKRIQELHQHQDESEPGIPQESMYCKELLLSGVSEFCFEEMRAACYHQKMTQKTEVRGQTDQASATDVK